MSQSVGGGSLDQLSVGISSPSCPSASPATFHQPTRFPSENEELEDFEDEDDMSTFNPELQPQVQLPNQPVEGCSTSKKRKRTSLGKDDSFVEAIKEACLVMAEKFSDAAANLTSAIKLFAHKHETKAQASTLWTEMRKIEGLTQHEMHAGYLKIIHNKMLLVGFNASQQKKKLLGSVF